jgi:GR25 family glycosyltransferase involved in LPS biosynthesis
MKIDCVYIISLDHDPRYLSELIDRVRKIPLPQETKIVIKKGFLGTKLKDIRDSVYTLYEKWDLSESGNDYFFWKRPVKYGEAGGMISHTQCWEHAYKNNYETILILEDDFTLLTPITWDIFDELDGYDWELCLLAHNSLHDIFKDILPPLEIKCESFVKPTFFYNTHSYILKSSAIKKLVDDHLPVLKKNIIVSDEFLSAVIASHPRKDMREMFITNISAVATRENYTGQSRYEMLGNSTTEPE